MAGLNISTFRFAIFALFSLLISSSVLPLNMLPQITSIQPRRSPDILGSINILNITFCCIQRVSNFNSYNSNETSKVYFPIERVGVLINKLQEQLSQKADVENMLVTAQLLHNELLMKVGQSEAILQKKVSVVVPRAAVVTREVAQQGS